MNKQVALGLLCGLIAIGFWPRSSPGAGPQTIEFRPPVTSLTLPAPDPATLKAEDVERSRRREPLRYGVGLPVDDVQVSAGQPSLGRWEALPDGLSEWRVTIESKGATSLDFGFTEFYLSAGASLSIVSADKGVVHGPYTDADNESHGQLWTPVSPGDRAQIVLRAPALGRDSIRLKLGRVTYGYVAFWDRSQPKSGSCNVDVVCSQGDAWREQIRSVGVYGLSSGISSTICTGQLVNDVAGDRKPYFLTANHCGVTTANAASVVVYWNYQNSTCRAPGSAASGSPGDGPVTQTQSGSFFRAKSATAVGVGGSDFTLVELDDAPASAFNVFWSGWDRRNIAPSSATAIHHPQTDEKRISFENQPLSITNYSVNTPVAGGSHLRVADWDLGTTEQGSSGSGLWNAEKRLVGVLSGGEALCGNDLPDWFGRFSVAWEGTGTADRRLRDWLDPSGSGAEFIDGRGGCTPPIVSLAQSPAAPGAGENVTYTASASGGAGGYSYAFDVDGDGIVDRSSSANTLAAAYPTATTTTVAVTVTDSGGCTATAQRAVNISAPDIGATAQPAQQLCGDNDAVIEPGERWQVPVNLSNFGGRSLNSGYAVFGKESAAAVTLPGGPDAFGYRYSDNANAACPFNFVDISGTASALSLTEAGPSFPANDDGHSAALTLGAPLNFYGSTVNALVMSTNGYLSTASSDSGGDYDNTCQLGAPDRGSSGGRFNVLHDDLVTSGGLRRQRFATCPRAPDTGGSAACSVFQWSGMGQYQPGGSATGNFEFQAIVYETTHEIVYQYRSADPNSGGGSSTGIQNAAASDRLQYACNQSNSLPASRAVCLFHPSAQPSGGAAAAYRLETPVLAVSNLASGQNQTLNASFTVNSTATCGANLRLNYVGTVDNAAYSMRGSNVLSTTLGGGGACQVSSCQAQVPTFVKKNGLYSSQIRYGNGIGTFVIPVAAPSDPVFFGAWFSGERNRNPLWYTLQGPIVDNQATAVFTRARQNVGAQPFSITPTTVGSALVSYIDATQYIVTYVLDGQAGGEKMSILFVGSRPQPERTGIWFYAAESGWGQVIDDHFLPPAAVPDQWIINYIYDSAGQPRWTLGSSGNVASGSMNHVFTQVHCPTCPSLPDFLTTSVAAGTVTRSFTSTTSGTYSSAITYPASFGVPGGWTRNNVPILMISAPEPP